MLVNLSVSQAPSPFPSPTDSSSGVVSLTGVALVGGLVLVIAALAFMLTRRKEETSMAEMFEQEADSPHQEAPHSGLLARAQAKK